MPANSDGVNIVITGDASQVMREFERIEQSVNSLLSLEIGLQLEKGFGNILSSITAGFQRVASAVTNIAKSALTIGGSFEAQMTTVKVISGATGEELETLTKKAREMGATLPITAKDAAMAMTVMAQRGTSVKDILASVTDVSNLAISQGISMANAADLLGSTMTNFGITVEDAAKVTAIFNNASNQSALNMSKLTEALKYVGPTAGSMGMELTEVISAMEAAANIGLQGEMIGAGLAGVLTKLSTKARIMGVETKDLQGNLRPLVDIFSELKAKGMSTAEATEVFGARGRLAALALVQQSDALKTNEERLKNWGSTQSAVDEKAKTFTNTMAALTSAIEEIHIEIFEQIKNQSKGAVAGITELVRALSDWVGKTKAAEKALNAFLDGLGFNIPSGEEFKRLLDQLDVQSVVDKVRSFGAVIKSIAESIASFVDKIKTPLLFLIEHLDTFATISFWGWIIGKGIQIPAIIINIAASFMKLCSALKALNLLNLANITTFLSSPVTWSVAGIAALGTLFYKMREAKQQLREAEEQEKRYLQEQAQADSTLDLDIEFNIKTGFEKLPASWTKASDELRDKANATVHDIQEAFRNDVGKAIDDVIAQFPDMAEAFNNTADIMSDSSLRKITQALQGNKETFDALPPHLQKVTEQLYYMGVQAGQTVGDFENITQAYAELKQQISTTKLPQLSDVAVFNKELSEAVNNLIAQLPASIERMQKFVGNQNLDIAVKFSLKNAQENIKQLSKSFAEKFNLPKEFISSTIFTQLKSLADKGDETAQSLYNGWKNSTEAIDNFLQKAQDAVTYLGESPNKFLPALNSLMRGIQKIDPITGKVTEQFKKTHDALKQWGTKAVNDFFQSAQDAVTYLGKSPDKFTPALNSLIKSIQKIDPITGKVTEQFKKAYDALKQWSNVTFSQLEQRIQRLRKAVESGLVDKSVLDKEFRRVSQQVKLKIATELEPTRSSYQSQSAFNSVVASEYFSRMGELGGEAFMDLVQKEFENLYDKSGSSIGAAIMREVDRASSSAKSILKIDGVDMSKQDKQTLSINLTTTTKSFDAVLSTMKTLAESGKSTAELLGESGQAAAKVFGERAQATAKGFAEAGQSIINKFEQFNPQQYAPNYDVVSKDYSSQLAGIIQEIQNVSASINTLNTLVQGYSNSNNVAAHNMPINTNTLITTGNNSSETFASSILPLTNSVQALSETVRTIQGINQANASAIVEITSAIKAVELAVKSINSGDNYDIDITQQGFVIQKKSDATSVAQSMVNALRSGFGNGGV